MNSNNEDLRRDQRFAISYAGSGLVLAALMWFGFTGGPTGGPSSFGFLDIYAGAACVLLAPVISKAFQGKTFPSRSGRPYNAVLFTRLVINEVGAVLGFLHHFNGGDLESAIVLCVISSIGALVTLMRLPF